MVLNSVDMKIDKWTREDFDELVNSFTEEEIDEMADYLEYMFNRYDDNFRYSFSKDYEYNYDSEIVYDYIRHTIYNSIGEDSWSKKTGWFSILASI